MCRRPWSWLVALVVLLIFILGALLLFGPGYSRPTFDVVRVELGSALMGGLLVALAIWLAEHRLKLQEKRTAEQEKRNQYQLALGMAETLAGRDFSGLDLSGLQLPSRDFHKTRFKGTNLEETDLTWANLSGADLAFANLRGANLCEANLTGANLASADLTGANLLGADLSPSAPQPRLDAVSSDLASPAVKAASRTNLAFANLSGADLGETNLTEAIMKWVKWDPKNPPRWPSGFDPPKNAWGTEEDR